MSALAGTTRAPEGTPSPPAVASDVTASPPAVASEVTPFPAGVAQDIRQLRVARTAVGRWLLDGPAQRSRGAHAGAVAGWVEREDRVDYWYPEITGYFLQWLSSCGDPLAPTDALAVRAARAQDWLGTWLASSPVPPTRVYAEGSHDDWRNRAMFCFDLAMVLRGLAAAARASLLTPDRRVVDGVCTHLDRLIGSDGCFVACRGHDDATMPVRWSTRPGAFLAKAAAGILLADHCLEIPTRVRDAAQATLAVSLQLALSAPHDETHPFLYGFEGALACMGGTAPAPSTLRAVHSMAERLARLLQIFSERGCLPEAGSHAGAARLDIVAQSVRIGLVLRTLRPELAPAAATIDALLGHLLQAVRPDGSMPFVAEAGAAQGNTWTAMFTEQALALAEAGAAGSCAMPILV